MAENKKMTRIEALNIAIAEVTSDEARAVLAKMVEQLAKPRKRPEGPTKAQRENIILAEKLAEAIAAHGEPVTPKWVTEHIPGIMTSQKVSAVAKVAAAAGLITITREGRAVVYSA